MEQSISDDYGRRKRSAETEYARWYQRNILFAAALVLAGPAFVWSTWMVVHVGGGSTAATLSFMAVIVLLTLFLRSRKQAERAARLVRIYEDGLARVSRTFPQTSFTGEAFAEIGHLYQHDLNVLGENSLFSMLAITRTAIGQRGLARLLLRPVSTEGARERQAAVKELAPEIDLRECLAMLGQSAFDDLPADSFEIWLASRDTYPKWVRGALLVTTILFLSGAAVGFWLHWPLRELAQTLLLPLAAQGVIGLWLRDRVLPELRRAHRLKSQAAILRDGMQVLRATRFERQRLQTLQAAVERADEAITKLQKTLQLIEQRSKDWFYPPAVLLCLGTHAAISLNQWKRKYGTPMLEWLDAWSEFEALVALAGYAAEHEENVWPEIADSGAVLDGEGMAHPLLSHDTAVGNDVLLGEGVSMLVISGSNMAGKSTLLRTVGSCVVLAMAGTSVPARRLRLRAVHVGASLAVEDSLADGKSKFLAEVERLRALLSLAQENHGAMLFLIDEIFSGTNSADRRVAAESVARALVETGAVGAVSTHDLALAEIAEIAEIRGRNMHMASPDERDPLRFDFLLKDGVNQTTNALAIVKMLGLA